MKILHLVKHCDRSHGNAQVAVDLACEQAASGHKVIFASSGGSLKSLLVKYDVECAGVDQSGGILNVLQNLTRFIRLVFKVKPDVIHAHMMSSAIFGFVASKLTGIPLVTTVHNSFDKHSVIMRLGKTVVAVSEAERDALIARGFRPHKVVAVLNGPNGAPREVWGAAYEGAFQTPSITMVCGLHPRKGVQNVLEAFKQVHSTFPEWHLNIIGSGAHREELEAQAVVGAVHFLGPVDCPKPLLEKSEVFISASYAEPCGLSITEARDAGCAIIGTRVGGTPELLEHGNVGILVEPGDIKALAFAITALLSDPVDRERWRAKARSGAQYFNIHRLAVDYECIYKAAGAYRGKLPWRQRSAKQTPVSSDWRQPRNDC